MGWSGWADWTGLVGLVGLFGLDWAAWTGWIGLSGLSPPYTCKGACSYSKRSRQCAVKVEVKMPGSNSADEIAEVSCSGHSLACV